MVKTGADETKMEIPPALPPKGTLGVTREETRYKVEELIVEMVVGEMEMGIEEMMKGLPPKLPPELWMAAGAERDDERDLKAVKADDAKVPIWLCILPSTYTGSGGQGTGHLATETM